MQEELNSRTMSLIIETGKMTTNVLQKAMKESLHLSRKTAGVLKERKARGKQSLSKLKENGISLSSVEITKDNIKSFDSVAKKYHIGYALMKQDGRDRYYVFFKASDAQVLEAAFREYARKEFQLEEKGSLRDVLKAVELEKAVAKAPGRKIVPEIKVPELKR